MFNARVATNYANGTLIGLEPDDALNFIMGLSITVINTVRDTVKEVNEIGDIVTKSRDRDVMHLINYYNSGVPGIVYSTILQTNADILLKFVRDIVLSDTTKALYLFYNKSRKTGATPYDLVIKALEDVHQYYMVHGTDYYRENETVHFNRYNDKFLKLMEG